MTSDREFLNGPPPARELFKSRAPELSSKRLAGFSQSPLEPSPRRGGGLSDDGETAETAQHLDFSRYGTGSPGGEGCVRAAVNPASTR